MRLGITGIQLDGAIELLADAGVAPLQAPRALLESGEDQRPSTIQRLMRVVLDCDRVAYGDRNFELAYLANVLLAGCSIQARPFAPREAADGAVAICNLGLERHGDVPADFLISHDLIAPFQAGWGVLHREVCIYSANALAEALLQVRVHDADLQSALSMLRVRLLRDIDKGTPWNAAAALDVLTAIDLPAWAALVALIAECPVVHSGLRASLDPRARSVDPAAFEFFATIDQLALVRKFMEALPATLSD